MSSDNKSSKVPLIVTIAMAVIAVAAVIMLVINGTDKEPDNGGFSEPSEIVFSATPELYTECENAASALVSANYEIIRLFVTEGLPVKKVYGKDAEPIDGAYVIDSDKYTEFSQIEALVKSVYSDEAAEKILTDCDVTLAGLPFSMQVYADHNVNGDVFFGINSLFLADDSYTTDWSNCFIMTEPHNMDSCDVFIYVNGVTSENASAHPESVLKTGMVRTANGWRFTKFLK